MNKSEQRTLTKLEVELGTYNIFLDNIDVGLIAIAKHKKFTQTDIVGQ